MSEAASTGIEWLQSAFMLDLFEAFVELENIASRKLLFRLGFQEKGISRDGAKRYEEIVHASPNE